MQKYIDKGEKKVECKYEIILEVKEGYKKKGQLKIIHISHLPITKSGWHRLNTWRRQPPSLDFQK